MSSNDIRREFADHKMGYPGENRSLNVSPDGHSRHSMISRERSQISGDEQKIMRANEVLLLSAKKENNMLAKY